MYKHSSIESIKSDATCLLEKQTLAAVAVSQQTKKEFAELRVKFFNLYPYVRCVYYDKYKQRHLIEVEEKSVKNLIELVELRYLDVSDKKNVEDYLCSQLNLEMFNEKLCYYS